MHMWRVNAAIDERAPPFAYRGRLHSFIRPTLARGSCHWGQLHPHYCLLISLPTSCRAPLTFLPFPSYPSGRCSVLIHLPPNPLPPTGGTGCTVGPVLNLGEVELYEASGNKISTASLSASMSSAYNNSMGPSRCIDGDIVTRCRTAEGGRHVVHVATICSRLASGPFLVHH